MPLQNYICVYECIHACVHAYVVTCTSISFKITCPCAISEGTPSASLMSLLIFSVVGEREVMSFKCLAV